MTRSANLFDSLGHRRQGLLSVPEALSLLAYIEGAVGLVNYDGYIAVIKICKVNCFHSELFVEPAVLRDTHSVDPLQSQPGFEILRLFGVQGSHQVVFRGCIELLTAFLTHPRYRSLLL